MSSFWKNKNILITGATGMVGSWLVKELLRHETHITALVLDQNPQSELYRSKDIERLTIVNGNLENFRDIERAINENAVDTVFHLGAQTIVNTAHRFPLATWETNIRGTYNLLEACRIHSAMVQRIVIASSDKAYGESTKLPYTENMPLRGRFPYEASKSCADLIAQSYAHTYHLPVAIIRCGNIYGGGDLNWSRIIPGTIRSLLANEQPVIRSNGKFIRDYVYVKDVCRMYIEAASAISSKKIKGEVFNFSDETTRSVLEIVQSIQKLMHCEHLKPKILDSAEGEIPSQYLSSAKIKKWLKCQPQFTLEKGLAETIEWYRQFFRRRSYASQK